VTVRAGSGLKLNVLIVVFSAMGVSTFY